MNPANEGPQILAHAGRTFLLYSCGAAWLPTYKLGLLELTGHDPMDPASWQKHSRSVFQSTPRTFGVGHSCFVSTGDPASPPGGGHGTGPSPPDRPAWRHVYHAKRGRAPGWPRDVFLQPFHFDTTGFPQFGDPLPPGSQVLLPAESSP